MIPKSHTKTFTAPEIRAILLSLLRKAPLPAHLKVRGEYLVGRLEAPDLQHLLWLVGRTRGALLNLMLPAVKSATHERAVAILLQLPEVDRLAPKGRP